MASIPSMKKEEVRFRAPSSSEEYNRVQEDIFYDITNLFNLANALEKELYITNHAVATANRFQQMRIRELQHQLMKIEAEMAASKTNSGTHVALAYVEDFAPDMTVGDAERIYIDTYHGLAHLPITGKHISKVYIYDEVANAIVTPSALQVNVEPQQRRGWVIEENDVLNAFNGDNHSYWHRKVMMPLETVPRGPVQCTMDITLPDTIISNRDINMIYLHPFPLNTLTIDKIEYQLDGGWKLLPGWPTDPATNLPLPYQNVGNMKFCFPSTAISKIRVTMTQPRYVEENFKKVYHFGMQEFGVFYTDYQTTKGKVDIPFTLTSPAPNKLITGITPKFFNEGVLSDKTKEKATLFSYNIYTIDEQGQLQYTKDTFPIMVSSNTILVKATVHADPQTKATPALQSVELTYQDL